MHEIFKEISIFVMQKYKQKKIQSLLTLFAPIPFWNNFSYF